MVTCLRKKGRRGVCALCGEVCLVTKEHFVMQGLWFGARPNGTLTVRTCAKCNHGASDDDEYFRNMIAIAVSEDHPGARRLFESKVISSLRSNRKMRQELFRGMTYRKPTTPQGLLLPTRPFYEIDAHRMDRILCKIVRGLFFKARNRPLPKSYGVYLLTHADSANVDFIQSFCSTLCPPQTFGDDVFFWRFSGDPSDENMTRWVFGFYNSVAFLAATLPK